MYNTATKREIKPYNIETIKVDAGDIILLHLSNDINMEMANCIFKDISKIFPNNQVITCNENILKGLTIIRPSNNNSVGIATSKIDTDFMFDIDEDVWESCPI